MADKFYARPSGFTKGINGVMGWLGAHGIGPKKTVRLEVKGRKSGVVRSAAVNIVSMTGSATWSPPEARRSGSATPAPPPARP